MKALSSSGQGITFLGLHAPSGQHVRRCRCKRTALPRGITALA